MKKATIIFLFFVCINHVAYSQKTYAAPTQKVVINNWNDSYDQAYSIGWNKSGKYYAYMVTGYIDGAVDGLTTRLYIVNTFNNIVKKELTAYTNYDTPIEDAWKQNYTDIQRSLSKYGIIASNTGINLSEMPVLNSKNDSTYINFEIKDTSTTIFASATSSNIEIISYNYYIGSIKCIGWMPCPCNKNIAVVFTSANIGSSENYIKAFCIDHRYFLR